MAGVKTAIILQDKMSGVMKQITKAGTVTVRVLKDAETAGTKAFDPRNAEKMTKAVGNTNDAIKKTSQNTDEAEKKQKHFNDQLEKGSDLASGLAGKIKGLISAYAGIQAVKKTADFVSGSFDLYNVQNRAETQLKSVLHTVGATEDAFERLKKTASAIQGQTMFGDEALLGGAAEFATYISDAKAIESMMKTLSNYAAGMSGGTEVGYEEMVNYATNLGKVFVGSFDAMTKKGFEFTEEQKEIIKTGTDMQKALVIDEVISESWDNLAAQMTKTPTGKITQLKNAFGDMREELAKRLLPSVMKIFGTVESNMPKIERLVLSLEKPVSAVIDALGWVLDKAAKVYEFFADNWPLIVPIVGGVAAVIGVMNLMLNAEAIAHGLAAAAAKIHELAEKSLGYAILFVNSNLLIGIAVVAAVIAAFAGLCVWLGKTKGKAETTSEAFVSGLYVVGEACQKTFDGIVNVGATALENLKIDFHNTIQDIKYFFWDLLSQATYVVGAIASLLNKLPFVNIDVGNIYSKADEWARNASNALGEKKNNLSYSKSFNAGARFDEENWAENAAAEGLKKAQEIRDKYSVSNLLGDIGTGQLGDISSNVGTIADNTGDIANSLATTNEELQWIRDLAEREAINRFTTAEVKIDMTGMTNRIDNDVDVDGIFNRFVGVVDGALRTTAAGVY